MLTRLKMHMIANLTAPNPTDPFQLWREDNDEWHLNSEIRCVITVKLAISARG